MIERAITLVLAIAAFGAPVLRAADTAAVPDFKEVQQVVREHLAGATDDTVNVAAVDGLLSALDGRVLLVTNTETAAQNPGTLVTRPAVFEGMVGYVRVGSVESGLAPSLAAAVSEACVSNKLAGLVLDLRFAGGWDYPAAARVVDLFLSKQVPLENAGGGIISSQEKTNAIRLPVVALINSGTSSAAEALAAMLRQTGVGLLVGSRTAGRAGVMSDYRLTSGQTLRVMTAPILLGDAKAVPLTGILPDISVAVRLDEEKVFFADPYGVEGALKKPDSGAASTNTTTAARPPKRMRVTEADLVRERRGEGDVEAVTSARVKSEPETPFIQDPALVRAIDLLKGLAVVRQGRI